MPENSTQAAPATVNRIGVNTTTLSAVFTDADNQPVGDFRVTFRIRGPDPGTSILDLVVDAAHGTSGVTIVRTAAGVYTASYAYDPADAQGVGYYDLYFEVSDGSVSAVDGYMNNSNELGITN